jgi:outer membrane biosynthesis protein TonB
VKKGDLLHFGEAEASRIIIDGVQILPKGPHSIKRLSNEPTKSIPAADKEIKPEPVPPAPEIKPEPRPQPKRKTTPPNRKPKPVSKPTPKPSPPKPEAPAVDREKLRQLMREPE